MRRDRVALGTFTGLVVVVFSTVALIAFGVSAWTSESTHAASSSVTTTSVAPGTTTSAVSSTTTAPSTTTTTTSPSVTSTTTASPVIPNATPSVGSDALAEWTSVAVCEEGGWIGSSGSAYPDSLGIMAAGWYGHGGGSDESPVAQVAVAQSLVASLVGTVATHQGGVTIYAAWVPDQGFCAAWP